MSHPLAPLFNLLGPSKSSHESHCKYLTQGQLPITHTSPTVNISRKANCRNLTQGQLPNSHARPTAKISCKANHQYLMLGQLPISHARPAANVSRKANCQYLTRGQSIAHARPAGGVHAANPITSTTKQGNAESRNALFQCPSSCGHLPGLVPATSQTEAGLCSVAEECTCLANQFCHCPLTNGSP